MITGRGLAAAGATLAVAALLSTPFCGTLFDCGCTWPWSGGATACAQLRARGPHCPWCDAPQLWWSCLGFAALCGAVVALRGDARSRAGTQAPPARPGLGLRSSAPLVSRGRDFRGPQPRRPGADFLVRTLAGVGAFLVVGFAAAFATGTSQFVKVWSATFAP